ncbi:PP2C family protein-serine/threonine phosphatase [Alkalicoccus urumqiensis]|nr:PP2C family protein-serine/threonine phosphatase [Alkalicoccus urumqiensis]
MREVPVLSSPVPAEQGRLHLHQDHAVYWFNEQCSVWFPKYDVRELTGDSVQLIQDFLSFVPHDAEGGKDRISSRQLMDTLPYPVFTFTVNMAVCTWNLKMEGYIEDTAVSLSDCRLPELFLNQTEEKLEAALFRAAADGTSTFRGNLQSRSIFYTFDWDITPLYDEEGDIYAFSAFGRNQTRELDLEQEVLIAGMLQKSMMPPPLRDARIRLDPVYQPAGHVSGDTYGYYCKEDGRKIYAYLIDVMGHGLPTAIQTAAVRLLFEQAGRSSAPLHERMAQINAVSYETLPVDYFAAAIMMEFDLETNELSYTSAGVNHFLHGTTEGTASIETPSPFIGMFENATFTTETFFLQDGEHVHLLSDGIFDLIHVDKLAAITNYDDVCSYLKTLAVYHKRDDATAASMLILPAGDVQEASE